MIDKTNSKGRLISVSITVLVILMVIFSGPASAVTISITGLSTEPYTKGSEVNFQVSVTNEEYDKYVPISNFSLNMIKPGPVTQGWIFAKDGNVLSGDTSIISIVPVSQPGSSDFGYGYGYGYDFRYGYGYGYDFGYGYGYGYDFGAGGGVVTYIYDVTLNTTDFDTGTYTVSASLNTGNAAKPTFASPDATFIITPAELPAQPDIIWSSPSSPVNDNVGAVRTFSVITDLIVDIEWLVDDVSVQTNQNVTISQYTNTNALAGIHNVSAIASNTNGSDIKSWEWIVSSEEGWVLDLTADLESVDKGNWTFGVDPNATDSYDASFDVDSPPAEPSGFDLYFNEPGVSTGKLMKDIKALGISKNWTLLVTAPSQQTVNVTWTSTDIKSNVDMELQEIDLASGNPVGSPIDMKVIENISITGGAYGATQKGYRITGTTTTAVYGINVSVDATEKSADQNVTAAYTITLDNTGNTADTYSLDWVNIDGVETVSISPESVSVGAGQSSTATLSISNRLVGKYRVAVNASSQSDPYISDAIITTTNVTPVDLQPPVISITYPVNGSSINLFNNIIKGNITDEHDILAAALYLNDTLVTDLTEETEDFNERVNYEPGKRNNINITAVDEYLNTITSLIWVNVLSPIYTVTVTIPPNSNHTIDARNETDSVVELGTGNNSVTVNVNITASTNATDLGAANNPIPGYGIGGDQKSLARYVRVNVTGDVDNVTWMSLFMYYTDADLDMNGDGDINEQTLKMYWYNPTTQMWMPLVSGANYSGYDGPTWKDGERNTSSNYLWVKVDHFSIFAIVGEEVDVDVGDDVSDGASSSGGGGGGSYSITTPTPTPTATVNETATITPTERPTEGLEEIGVEEPTSTPEAKKGIPGFGVITALSGLLALVYILLRKKE